MYAESRFFFVPLQTQTMNDMKHFETIQEFNEMLGVETLHPMVSVVNLSEARPMKHMRHTNGCTTAIGGRYVGFVCIRHFFLVWVVLCGIMEVPKTVYVYFVMRLRQTCFCGIILSGDAEKRTSVRLCRFCETT